MSALLQFHVRQADFESGNYSKAVDCLMQSKLAFQIKAGEQRLHDLLTKV